MMEEEGREEEEEVEGIVYSVCVCVRVCGGKENEKVHFGDGVSTYERNKTDTHTHTSEWV